MSGYRNYRGAFVPAGMVSGSLAIVMLAAAGLGRLFAWLDPLPKATLQGGGQELLFASGVAAAGGVAFWLYGRHHRSETLTRREAMLSVALIWLSVSFFGAIPFVLGPRLPVADALFETVSGLTTTGSTILVDIEGTLNRPMLLWRSVLQWLGGMGIVVLFVAIYPQIGAGGKHMFGGEVPGTSSEGLKPRIASTSRTLWKLYVGFTALELVTLWALGMSFFEAMCHALTTMSTGGFSTRDASIAAFDSAAIEMVIASFMLVASVNYAIYYAVLRKRDTQALWRSSEFKAFALTVLVAILVLTVGLVHGTERDWATALRHAVFSVGTFISSTGYGTHDYMSYPASMLLLIIGIMIMGGCAGSTAGGVKIERVILAVRRGLTQIRRSFRPSLVTSVRFGGRVIPEETLTDVLVFLLVYAMTLLFGMVAFSIIEGVPIPTAFGASLTCLSNMGPAPFYRGVDNFAAYGTGAKMVAAVLMLLGRLEFFTLLALLVPGFWRR